MGLSLKIETGWAEGDTGPAILEFDQDRVVVGRRAGCDVQLPHPAVSGHHATLRASGAGYSVIDEDSTNGVKVNDQRVSPLRAKALRSGDLIHIGGFELRVDIRAVGEQTSADGTAALALRLFRAERGDEIQPEYLSIENGPRAGERLDLPPPPSSLVIGRGGESELLLSDADLSREHAELIHDLDGYEIRDLGSKNGLTVNGRALRQRRLCDGDEIKLGATILVFHHPAEVSLKSMALEADEKRDFLPQPKPKPASMLSAQPTSQVESCPPTEPSDSSGSSGSSNVSDVSDVSPTPAEAPDLVDELPVLPSASVRESPTGAITLPPPPEGDAAEKNEEKLVELPARSGQVRADVAIYVLAGTVLALSLAGLFWLLTSR